METGILRKIAPPGNIGEDVRTTSGPWEGRRGLGDKLAVKFPALELKAGEILELSLKSSTQIRQVGRSALTSAKGPEPRLGGDYLGAYGCLGPPRASDTPNGLEAEISVQLPRLGKFSHQRIAYP